jgi:hypothetical protein
MRLDIERIVAILSLMYGKEAELVADITNRRCFLFFDGIPQKLDVLYGEILCLEYNDIIEMDSGCTHPEHETEVYILTAMAQQRISDIIQNKKVLRLKE